MYFSMVTEATLGYGDVRPVGYSRWIACVQVGMGLVLCGVVVAKLTSVNGRTIRLAAYSAGGDWCEIQELPDGRLLFCLASIELVGDVLRYDGDNYYEDGQPAGFFRGRLDDVDGSLLTFSYSNRDSVKSHYVEGVCKVRFSKDHRSSRWSHHQATAVDLEKGELHYEGWRARRDEAEQVRGTFLDGRRAVIRKYAATYRGRKPQK